MVPFENGIEEILAVVPHIPWFAQVQAGAQEPIYFQVGLFFGQRMALRYFGITGIGGGDHIGHTPVNGFIGAEKINECNEYRQDNAHCKTAHHQQYFRQGKQFLVARIIDGFDEVKHQESKWYHRIVDTIF